MTLAFEHVADGALFGANARFEAGCWPVVGASMAPLATLVTLAAGAHLPARGRVSLSGAVLFDDPSARRSVGSLLAYEALPPDRNVESAVSRILSARGDAVPARTHLASLGLEGWGKRPVSDLDSAELRSLALGLALAHEQARLLVLYEPFATLALAPELVRERMLERAERGAIVLVATTSYDVARSLGGVAYQLDSGVLNPARIPLGPIAAPCLLSVRTPEPERLVAVLSADPAVAGARHDPATTANTVYVHGDDLEALALAVGRAALGHGIDIDSVVSATLAPSAATAAQPTSPNVTVSTTPDARPADQSVSMPTAFADPTRPPDQSVALPSTFADPTRPPHTAKDGDA